MKTLNIIISPQDYERANHQKLWKELSKNLYGETLILDLPADYLVTHLKKKKYRFEEAMQGKRNIGENLSIIRPMFLLRPEITPKSLDSIIIIFLIMQLKKYYPDIADYKLNILTYSRLWIDKLSKSNLKINFFYYILDEFRYFPNKSEENVKAINLDEKACVKSKFIFTMSDEITKKRNKYREKMITIGNGAKWIDTTNNKIKLNKSVAFIGNFRNWIDVKLLQNLIQSRPDVTFGFAGPVENDMQGFFKDLLNNNSNTIYLGITNKEKVVDYYKMFNAVIVPYQQNDFMKATRPIKIVESIFAGTPVITIPMDGYQKNSFIRFAKNVQEFSDEINNLINNPIDKESEEYKNFLIENSWNHKAKVIADKIKKYS
ncbi:hypothetical protein CIB95_11605 [Lottiidibacillus patelloidae]|uniref:Glycosyl transferase family 1 domain-containing protein n=1 Tax=Lottiidibacillus patelloidae TaxID=2670334 RepID=A0A263BRS5_9BACI|nr:glycosyltransferase [Lottiidibacillus patelloidae]OZM56413.1 hypothetical protein CIB95_11605 [Lottiidibacillus patelloidae]